MTGTIWESDELRQAREDVRVIHGFAVELHRADGAAHFAPGQLSRVLVMSNRKLSRRIAQAVREGRLTPDSRPQRLVLPGHDADGGHGPCRRCGGVA